MRIIVRRSRMHLLFQRNGGCIVSLPRVRVMSSRGDMHLIGTFRSYGVALYQRGEVLACEEEEFVAEECTLVGRSACAFTMNVVRELRFLQRCGLNQFHI